MLQYTVRSKLLRREYMRKLISPKKLDDMAEEAQKTKKALSAFLEKMPDLSTFDLSYIGSGVITLGGLRKHLDTPVLERVVVEYYPTADSDESAGTVALPLFCKSSETFAYGEAAYAPWGGSKKTWAKAWYLRMPYSYSENTTTSMIVIKDQKFTLSDGSTVTPTHGVLDRKSITAHGDDGYRISLALLDSSARTLGTVYLDLLTSTYNPGSVDDIRKQSEAW